MIPMARCTAYSVNRPCRQNRLDSLKAHFNAAYEELLKKIDEQIEVIEQAAKDSASLELPHSSQFYEGLVKGYEDALAEFNEKRQEVSQTLPRSR